jgi:hypothetical protein
MGVLVLPDKANPVLVVDADAVLAFSISTQRLEMIAGWRFQIREFYCPMKDEKLFDRGPSDLNRDVS